jgi:hypothetical protein
MELTCKSLLTIFGSLNPKPPFWDRIKNQKETQRKSYLLRTADKEARKGRKRAKNATVKFPQIHSKMHKEDFLKRKQAQFQKTVLQVILAKKTGKKQLHGNRSLLPKRFLRVNHTKNVRNNKVLLQNYIHTKNKSTVWRRHSHRFYPKAQNPT